MRVVRLLSVLLVIGSTLGWGFSVPIVSGAAPTAPSAGQAAPAASATIPVTVEGDQFDDPNDPASATSGCSLREALLMLWDQYGNRGCGAAPLTATNVTIKVPFGDFVLTNPAALPPIPHGWVVTIQGSIPDCRQQTIDGGSQGSRHNGIFNVVDGELNLVNLTLQHGSRPGGGAIWEESGTVRAFNVCFDSNDAESDPNLNGDGGAIRVDAGALTVTQSIFKNNLAFDSGGAVSTSFGYFLQDSFVGNRATAGGALAVSPSGSLTVTVVQSQFKSNTARPQKTDQLPALGYTTHGDSNGGGAIQNTGNMELTQDLIQGNGTELMKGGGGVSNEAAGTGILSDTVVTGNTAVAVPSGESNSFIDYSWGGGIYNAGTLDLVRTSVYGNRADYAGAIFNHGSGDLWLFNSTVGNNKANQIVGGIINEHPKFDDTIGAGAQVHLVHATLGQNGSPSDSALYSKYPYMVTFSNSILDGPCWGVQYTWGSSFMTGLCDTIPDPSVPPGGSPDISMTSKLQLGLGPLVPGNGFWGSQFMVQQIDNNSIAAGYGREDQYGCSDPNINHRDQNLATRPLNHCDSGAYQSNSPPPQFSSNPPPGAPAYIVFPVVDFTQGQSSSQASLVLSNLGGGALTYQLQTNVVNAGSDAIVLDNPSASQGTIFRSQQVTLNFSCHPAAPNSIYWKKISIATNDSSHSLVDYRFHCAGAGSQPMADESAEPGPVNMPMPPPAMPAVTGFDLTNPGHMPLTVNYSVVNPGPPYGALLATVAGRAPSGPAATLNPGQSLHVDVTCTPTSPGVFLNTLTFNTNDATNPVIQYNLSCEAQVISPPEALSAATTYATGSQMEGVAVSPDGSQVVAGDFSDNFLQVYNRDLATGFLTPSGFNAAWPGMSSIYGVQYSRDGQNVYYSSANGNGIVTGDRSGPGFNLTQVFTSGTKYICGVNNLNFVYCPIGSMGGARGLAVSPDDRYVYVTGAGDSSLTVFQRDLGSGQLAYFQTLTHTSGGVNVLGGASRVAVSPDGNYVYVAASTDNAVDVFQRANNDVLSLQAVYSNGTGGLTELMSPTDVALSPDGNFVYVPANGSSALNVFSRSSADGSLSLSSVVTGVTGAWGVAITGDDAGRRLFLANYGGNDVQVYGRNLATGALTLVNTSAESGPVFMAVSPDNQDVYASLWNGLGVALLQTVHNPPVLSHISPASAIVNSGPFTLTAAGGRFYPDSKIVWAGTPLTTVFISDKELQAAITGGIGNQQVNNVLVRNTGPGGGDSNTQPFAVTSPTQPPLPSIESLDPPSAAFGQGDVVVVVHGANFAPDAQVYYNHAPVPTVFVDASTLQITLSSDIVSTPGDGGLEVTNGGAPALSALVGPAAPATSSSSTIVSFRVAPPGVPATPALTSLAPASVVSGSAPIWLSVTGYNFSSNALNLSVGRWNGLVRPTVVIDAHTLLMQLTRADLAAAGNGLVTVLTQGAGSSQPLTFRVRLPNEKPIPVVKGATLRGGILHVNGSDFDPAAQISLNGVMRTTTFVNPYEVTTPMTAAARAVIVKVTNPAPGGGTSNAVIVVLNYLFLPLVRR